MMTDPDRIHWPSLVQEGIAARRDADAAQWRLGDLALEVETTYGGHELQRYAEEIGVDYRNLEDYRRVAGAFQLSERSDNLGWSHHRVLAPQPDRLAWLRRAEKEGWSVRRLREEATEPRLQSLYPLAAAAGLRFGADGSASMTIPSTIEEAGQALEALAQLQEAARALLDGPHSFDPDATDDLLILYGQLRRRRHNAAALALFPELRRRAEDEIAELRRRIAALREAAAAS